VSRPSEKWPGFTVSTGPQWNEQWVIAQLELHVRRIRPLIVALRRALRARDHRGRPLHAAARQFGVICLCADIRCR
jgi:hypothetical protein